MNNTNNFQAARPAAFSAPGMNRNDAPGGGGRGAVLICSKCGNRYADTGIGCPVCNIERSEESNEQNINN